MSIAGTHEREEENFKEKLSSVECFQIVEENKDKNLQRVFEIFPLGAVVWGFSQRKKFFMIELLVVWQVSS